MTGWTLAAPSARGGVTSRATEGRNNFVLASFTPRKRDGPHVISATCKMSVARDAISRFALHGSNRFDASQALWTAILLQSNDEHFARSEEHTSELQSLR